MRGRWNISNPQQRDLEATERRNVVIESYRLPEEEVARRILSRDERVEAGKTRAWVLAISYIDLAAVFLIGFMVGYVISAFRG